MNKFFAFIAIAVIIIVGLNLIKASVERTQSVASTVSHGGIQALISQPTK